MDRRNGIISAAKPGSTQREGSLPSSIFSRLERNEMYLAEMREFVQAVPKAAPPAWTRRGARGP